MPRADYYEGLTLADALRAFADHHSAPRTRHITADETALIYRAAGRLEQVLSDSSSHELPDDGIAPVVYMPQRAVGG